ncbi:regulatory protein RecX [Arthrobacter sp. Sa2CUA1]|uniref:Regulatory protein RecX n=1 Tax=Arthrobacter gallicola TaxID=2762225 RepID=A0ABR8UUY2_9MICC|nr:regulatory protein RecX [Arthrobacter gallicola]MBD7995896.1 regulatory protein RecX [Arthrobacter gallicola]
MQQRRARKPGGGAQDGPTPGSAADSVAEADPYAVARAIVLRQLTSSAKSRRQLADKLAERGVPEEVAAAVLDRFEEVRLIDDAEFAQMWVRSRSQTRSLARSALRRELTEKGIAPELAEEALEQLSSDDERTAALELVRRKLRNAAVPQDRQERDKQVRRLVSMLARKGYSPSLGFAVVNEVLEDREAAEGQAADDETW